MGILERLLGVDLSATISPNAVVARNVKTGQSASVSAPFSCSHQLVSDIDILEEALKDVMARTAAAWWAFPRLTVSVSSRELHAIERKAIRDAAINAGASSVMFDTVRDCAEDELARSAYVRAKIASR